jgi:hypothetical protein
MKHWGKQMDKNGYGNKQKYRSKERERINEVKKGRIQNRKKQTENMTGRSKVFLSLINYLPRHEALWGSGGIAPPFLTWALDRGE